MSKEIFKSGCVVSFKVDVDIPGGLDLLMQDFLHDMRRELSKAANRVCAEYAGKAENYPVDVAAFDDDWKRIDEEKKTGDE